jgi:hypothetical protein
MDKRRFNAYLRRLRAVRKASQAYIDAEIEHLRFRDKGSKGDLPKRVEAKLRKFMDQHLTLIAITNLKVVDQGKPHVKGDHYPGDGCLKR